MHSIIIIYLGFAATEIIYNDDGSVAGVATHDSGIAKDGSPTDSFERGMGFRAKCTIFSEGCHGSLGKELYQNEDFKLRENCEPQTYATGIKELWRVPEENHRDGLVLHTVGWPVDKNTYAGEFVRISNIFEDPSPHTRFKNVNFRFFCLSFNRLGSRRRRAFSCPWLRCFA